MKLNEAITAAIISIDNARTALLVAGNHDQKLLDLLLELRVRLQAALVGK